jgi:hypothetical protein
MLPSGYDTVIDLNGRELSRRRMGSAIVCISSS